MVWSGSIGLSIMVPSDANPTDPSDTRDYIILGEDVPPEIASKMTAGLFFHNKSGFTDGINGTEPLYWALGITTTSGQLEMIAYYNLGNGGGFAYTAMTMFSMGLSGVPTINLGSSGGSFPGTEPFVATVDQLNVTTLVNGSDHMPQIVDQVADITTASTVPVTVIPATSFTVDKTTLVKLTVHVNSVTGTVGDELVRINAALATKTRRSQIKPVGVAAAGSVATVIVCSIVLNPGTYTFNVTALRVVGTGTATVSTTEATLEYSIS